ncbi:MAG: amidophosphoribosyltransferase [Gammaproteobacteria bacterium]|nr:amidophosphoribosyltransferase [Gammaproteobacteria bacterium]
MCGIIGVVGDNPVNQLIYDGLSLLQHRGQDAAGIMTCEGERLLLRKGKGLVADVFRERHMVRLKGEMGIGHVRYPTAGAPSNSAEAQPFYVNSPYGIALGHNGNLINSAELQQQLYETDLRHINTDSDSEVLLNVLAHELQQVGKLQLSAATIFAAVTQVHQRIRGAYAVVAMIAGQGILAFRDPHGIRPLVLGRRDGEQGGSEYMVASESVAVQALGFTLLRDVAPGEAVYIDKQRQLHAYQCVPAIQHSPCMFEFVYFARPDSIIDGISVYKSRLRMGAKLADKIHAMGLAEALDVVIPVPESSRPAAIELANSLGVKFREGFVKNRYIGRTFIMPGQSSRQKSVRRKLNAIDLEFKGKNVLLVDDSIVRGTTSGQIVQMAREAGARKVYFASAAPPVRYANVYGIDMPTPSELIAHGRSEAEIAEAIGADGVIYQDLEALVACGSEGNPALTEFDTSCFDGHYVTGGVDDDYLAQIGQLRADSIQQAQLFAEEDDYEIIRN